MKRFATERLVLRRFREGDEAFILELLNEPDWLRFIGDRGVRTTEAAREYRVKGPMAMYARHGFGFYAVELKEGGSPVGMCGLIKREGFAEVDLGFAFLERFRGRGYASEAAAATLAHGRRDCGLTRIVALTARDNVRSIALLEKLGFRYERIVRLASDGPESKMFAHDPDAAQRVDPLA